MAEATHCFIGVMDTVKRTSSEGSGGAMVGAVLLALCSWGDCRRISRGRGREEMGAADGYHARERVSERGGGEGIFV